MKICQTDKQIIAVQKPGVKTFLNGLTANTLEAPRNAFLTIHGRIIATFDQLLVSEDECWVLVEKPFVEPLLQHLDRYMKLGGVKLQRPALNVYFDLDQSLTPASGEYCIPQKKGQLFITPRTLEVNVSETEFTLFRLEHRIPVQGIDFTDEMLLNVSTDEFVSFKKGCFLGQEPISKVYNRSKPTWRLVVKPYDECDAEEKAKMTSRGLHPALKKELGFVFEKND